MRLYGTLKSICIKESKKKTHVEFTFHMEKGDWPLQRVIFLSRPSTESPEISSSQGLELVRYLEILTDAYQVHRNILYKLYNVN